MSCRQNSNKLLLVVLAVYLLLYVQRPLLPDHIRLPVVEKINAIVEQVLSIADPLLALVKLDEASRRGEGYTPATKFQDVPQLRNDECLTAALKRHEMVFLMVHAPWCGHCKNMHNDFAKLYDSVKNDFVNIPEGKVGVYTYNGAEQCKEGEKPCKIEALSPHVRGFPSLLLIETDDKGNPVVQKYEQHRTAKKMYDFLIDQLLEPILSEDAVQIKKYLGENSEGILHYVPKSMTIEQAKKKASGFSLRQQVFTRTYDVVKHFDRYNANFNEKDHIMLAFHEDSYIGQIPNHAPAPISTIVSMLVSGGLGRFSDKKFMNKQLPRYLLLTRLRSKEFHKDVAEDFLMKPFVQPQIIGQAVILLLEESQEDERIAYMVGMSQKNEDCMLLFDTVTSKRHGICVPAIPSWLSFEEFANYWLKAINGELPETNNVNYKACNDDCPYTILSKSNVDEFLKDNAKALLFTFSIAKHQDVNVKKFEKACNLDIPCAIIDMTLDNGLKTEFVDAKIGDKEQVLYFVNNKLEGTYEGEIEKLKLETFIQNSSQVAVQQDKSQGNSPDL